MVTEMEAGKVQFQRQVPPPDPLTTYGATRTTTFTTTVSVNGPAGTTLFYPWPAITGTPEFTTVTDLEGTRAKPVLVVTDVVGVILGVDGQVLRTATLNHQDPQNTGVVIGQSGRCVEFKCWSIATKTGVIFLAVFLGLVVLGVIIWCLFKSRKPERGGEGEVGLKKKGPLGMDGVEREQILVEDVERGERRRRRRRRKTRERSPSPESTGSESIRVVEPLSRSRHRTSGQYVRNSRDGRLKEEVDPRLPPGTYVVREPVDPYPPRSKNYTATARTPSVSPRNPHVPSGRMRSDPAPIPKRTNIGYADSTPRSMPNHTRTVHPPSKSPIITPSRDPFYAPRVRDFGAPSPRGEGREVTRHRDRSSYPPRAEQREGRASPHPDDIITVEIEEDLPPPRRRQRRRRSTGEEYITREESGRRRRERDDAEERHRSMSQSPRNREPEKEKKSTFMKNAKWLALLPLALRAINILAEPDGGWTQYHKGDGKGKKKNRVNQVPTQGIGPDLRTDRLVQQDRRRHPNLARRERRWNAMSGGRYPESHNRHSSSADSTRLHASLAIDPQTRRHRSQLNEEPFQRRRPRRQYDRAPNDKSFGPDGAVSDDERSLSRQDSEQQLILRAPMEVLPRKPHHPRRFEPIADSPKREEQYRFWEEEGKHTGRNSLDHIISIPRPLKKTARFDLPSSETLVG